MDLPTNETLFTHPRLHEIGGLPLSKSVPYWEPIHCLHAGADAVVTFHRKIGSNWENLGCIAASQLRAEWPAIQRFLGRDSYFSINSTAFYKQRSLEFPLSPDFRSMSERQHV
jgi:hypothetical protein